MGYTQARTVSQVFQADLFAHVCVHDCDWKGYSQDSDGEAGNWSLFSWEAYKQFRTNTPGFQDLAALQAGSMPLRVQRSGSSGRRIRRMASMSPGTFFRLWAFPRGAEGC
jgi:hypothetical protein